MHQRKLIHRRTFIRSATLAALSTSVAFRPSLSHEKAATAYLVDQPGVRLAVASVCFDWIGDNCFESTFRIAPAAGFKNIEFDLKHPEALTPSSLGHIAKRCQETGVRAISVQGAGFSDGRGPDVSAKIRTMQAAKKLGCRRVKFCGSPRRANAALARMIATLKEIAPTAEEMGMLVCLENQAGNSLENLNDYEEVFSAIDSPNVGLCLNAGHFDAARVSIPEAIERFHRKTIHVDLTDTIAIGSSKAIPYGEGASDLHGTVENLIMKGYQGYLVLEQAPSLNGNTLKPDIASSYQMFKKYESSASTI